MAARGPAAASPVRRAHGFTLVELIAVLLLVGVLAIVAMPRVDGALALRGAGWRDQVLAALRHAHATAQGHRRLVCVAVGSGAVTLSIAAVNPASACTAPIVGPDGDGRYAHDASGIATSIAPAGTLYFQPSGRITSDGAGTTALDATISIAGETGIAIVGETGHVQ